MATTDILCRFDVRDQNPVVFLRDTIQGDRIQVWTGKGNPVWMPLDYYRSTNPLNAGDEKVLADRYKAATGKQDQIIRITHRLPRSNKPLPSVLSHDSTLTTGDKGGATNKAASGNAKPIESQPAPQGPTGDLPKPGETLAASSSTANALSDNPNVSLQPNAGAAANPNEPPSAAMFRKIQELQARMSELVTTISTLNAQVRDATTDYETCKQACADLTKEFEAAIEAEAAEELRKRKEMLASVMGAQADPVAQFAAELAVAGASPVTTNPAPAAPPKAEDKGQQQAAVQTPAKADPKPRGQGGRFQKKTDAKK